MPYMDTRRRRRSRATPRRAALVSLGLLVAGLGGCASRQGSAAIPVDDWLAGKGFPSRGDWPSAALHLRGPQLRSTLRISELLRRVPQVRLRPGPANPLGLTRVLDDPGATCVLQVYLNGVPMVVRDAETRVDLDARVGVPDLDALELHLGPGGPVYDAEGCGSLLLWDRSMRHVEDPPFVGSLRGRVVGLPADTVSGVRIGPDGELRPPDSAGSFDFPGLLPGEYPVEVVLRGGAVLRRTARVYAHVESSVELRVRQSGTAPRGDAER
ncbi:MAG: hypothetical protein AMXMBFR53_05220 [Gemmatimonadota bacterium]